VKAQEDLFPGGGSGGMTPGAEMLAEGSTRQAMADISRCFSKTKVQHEAVGNERMRLARDLHDGVLQTLTGVTLQLEAASRLIAADPDAARTRLAEIGDLLATEQRELRTYIGRMQLVGGASLASSADLAAALDKLRQRTGHLSSVRVALKVDGQGGVPRSMGDEVFRIVQEALNNIVRHAHAQSAAVHLTIGFDRVHIDIADDGVGFPFHGTYTLAELAARNRGPVSLRGRVAALRGELVLTSSASGSSLEISLPNDQAALDWIHSRSDEQGKSVNIRLN